MEVESSLWKEAAEIPLLGVALLQAKLPVWVVWRWRDSRCRAVGVPFPLTRLPLQAFYSVQKNLHTATDRFRRTPVSRQPSCNLEPCTFWVTNGGQSTDDAVTVCDVQWWCVLLICVHIHCFTVKYWLRENIPLRNTVAKKQKDAGFTQVPWQCNRTCCGVIASSVSSVFSLFLV